MSNKYAELLPLCYEIEGLISMMSLRGNDIPEGVNDLVKEKIGLLSESLNHLSPEQPQPIDIPEAETLAPEEPEMNESDQEAVAESALMEEEEDADIESEPEADATSISPINGATTPTADPHFKVNYFSINDTYRFRRELFNNDAVEMTETLEVLSKLNTVEEAIDYLSNDLCWDIDEPTAKDFISIVLSGKN